MRLLKSTVIIESIVYYAYSALNFTFLKNKNVRWSRLGLQEKAQKEQVLLKNIKPNFAKINN